MLPTWSRRLIFSQNVKLINIRYYTRWCWVGNSSYEIEVPQGSVLGPLLLVIHINDLHNAIWHSQSYHFANDTHLLNICYSPKNVQKQLSIDLKLWYNWVLGNKVSLDKLKTEMIIFQKPGLKLNWSWNICLNGHKILLSDETKYLGIYLDKYLDGHYRTKIVTQKQKRALDKLSKVWNYVANTLLKNIYYALFKSHLRYGCQIWFQSNS